MKTYEVLLQPRAHREFLAVPHDIAKKIVQATLMLAENPRSHQSIKLSDTEGYRLRVGDYRILYEIEDALLRILVVRVGHRRDVYE